MAGDGPHHPRSYDDSSFLGVLLTATPRRMPLPAERRWRATGFIILLLGWIWFSGSSCIKFKQACKYNDSNVLSWPTLPSLLYYPSLSFIVDFTSSPFREETLANTSQIKVSFLEIYLKSTTIMNSIPTRKIMFVFRGQSQFLYNCLSFANEILSLRIWRAIRAFP